MKKVRMILPLIAFALAMVGAFAPEMKANAANALVDVDYWYNPASCTRVTCGTYNTQPLCSSLASTFYSSSTCLTTVTTPTTRIKP